MEMPLYRKKSLKYRAIACLKIIDPTALAPEVRLLSMAEGRSFSEPNIRLRPKVKNVATVQHCHPPNSLMT